MIFEKLFVQKTNNTKVRVLNLSGQGMNSTELFLYLIKGLSLKPDLIIVAFTPRDYVNEDTKSMGIISEYSKLLLEPSVTSSLLREHLISLNNNNKSLVFNSMAQYIKVSQREVNIEIEKKITSVWPNYEKGKLLRSNLEKNLYKITKIQPILSKINESQVKHPNENKPYYEDEPYPNVRSLQMKMALEYLKKNFKGKIIVYNEPIRPKTFNLYFNNESYQKKVKDLQQICKSLDIPFFDFQGKTEDEFFGDWIHLNSKGIEKLSQLLFKDINN